MINDTFQTDDACEFAETLIAVLYGEATVAEKRQFDLHTRTCVVCRAESISLGQSRNAVIEWRVEDFDLLKTPIIDLSVTNKITRQRSENKSWLEQLSDIFAIFTAQYKLLAGTSAFAGLVLILFLAIYASVVINRNSNANQQIAASLPDNNSLLNLAHKTPPNSAANSQTQAAQTINQALAAKNSNKNLNVTAISTSAQTKTKTTKALTPSLPVRRQPKTAASTVVAPPKSIELAIETVDETEDDSLRLSDLLDDVAPSS